VKATESKEASTPEQEFLPSYPSLAAPLPPFYESIDSLAMHNQFSSRGVAYAKPKLRLNPEPQREVELSISGGKEGQIKPERLTL
jgi:hypothetical protein